MKLVSEFCMLRRMLNLLFSINYYIVFPLAVFLFITVSHSDFVPIWDSLDYYETYFFKVYQKQFTFNNFLTTHNGHPS